MEQDQTEPIKIGIIEDLREIREGLEVLFNFTPGFTCTGSYRSVEIALSKLKYNVPDVLLSDIGLPGMTGIEGIRIFKEQHPQMKILMLSVYDDDERIFDALCAGASGYLLKSTPPTRLLENIKESVAGGAPISPEVASKVITLFRDIRPPDRSEHQLTPHEIRLLKLLVEGHNYATAAKTLGVSNNTIKYHTGNIFDKLQVHSKSEAVVKALRDRIV